MTRTALALLTACLLTTIGNGCFLQPVERIEKSYTFLDLDAPALRIAKPVTAELLEKNGDGEWVSIGKGTIPAGAYVKGRAPKGEWNTK